jgi:uncharacterized membrane protein
MTGGQVLVIVGGAVIVLGLAGAIYTTFIVSPVVGVLGLLILLVVGVLFSRQFGRDGPARRSRNGSRSRR